MDRFESDKSYASELHISTWSLNQKCRTNPSCSSYLKTWGPCVSLKVLDYEEVTCPSQVTVGVKLLKGSEVEHWRTSCPVRAQARQGRFIPGCHLNPSSCRAPEMVI